MTPRVRDDIYLHLAEAARPENEKPHEHRGLGNAPLSCARYFVLALVFGVGLLLCVASCALLVHYIFSVPSRQSTSCRVVYDGALLGSAAGVFLSASGGYLILRACRLIIHNSYVFVGLGTLMWGLIVLRYPLDPRTLSLTLCLISLGGYCVCKGVGLVARLRRRPRLSTASPIIVRVALVGWFLAFGVLEFIDEEYRRNRYLSPRGPSLGEAESVRAALASYAAHNVDHGYGFPAAPISDHKTFRALVYANDANIRETEPSLTVRRYIPMDHDADGVYEDYTMSLQIPKWDYDFIVVRPTEMTLCPTAKLAKPLALADILRQKGMLLAGTDCQD